MQVFPESKNCKVHGEIRRFGLALNFHCKVSKPKDRKQIWTKALAKYLQSFYVFTEIYL